MPTSDRRSDVIRRRREQSAHSARSPYHKPSAQRDITGWLKRVMNLEDGQRPGRPPQGWSVRSRKTGAGLGDWVGKFFRPRTARKAARSVPRPVPPVMTRNPLIGAAINRANPAAGASTRRPSARHDIPLRDLPGAEIRLPSLPHLNIGWRLISLVLALAAGVGIYLLWTAPSFQVREIQVDGLQRLNVRDIEIVLDIIDQPVFALDIARMTTELQAAFPEFKTLSVQVELPAKVIITVSERIPVLIWQQAGRTDLVDEQGVAFPERTAAVIEGLPVLQADGVPAMDAHIEIDPVAYMNKLREQRRNPEASLEDSEDVLTDLVPAEPPLGARQLIPPETVTAILAMAREAPQGTSLLYDKVHGFGWKDRRGWQVFFGDPNEMEMKLRIYDAILKHVKREDLQPALVSVENVHAPYYRLER